MYEVGTPNGRLGKESGRIQEEGTKINRRRRQCKASGGNQVGGRGRIGVEDKRKEGKLRRRRRQCKALGGTQVGGRGKNGMETKGRREN